MQTYMSKKLAEHVIAVYKAMDAEAVDVDDNRLYIGSLAVLVRSIASSTHYASITRALYDGGYAALLDRGGRSKPSTMLLLREPQEDELMALTMEADTPILTLINRIERVEANLGGVNVPKVLTEVERRLQVLETKGTERRGKSKKQ